MERLKIQQAYHEALKTNDFDTLRDLYAKYNKLLNSSTKKATKSTPGQTPAYFDTPYANEEPPKLDLKLSNDQQTQNISLDNFLAKNTSEDNVSFESLIEETEKKQKLKQHQCWLFEKEKFHQLKLESSLMLENPCEENEEITKSLDSWKYTSKNTLMYIPEGVSLTPEEELINSKKVRIINHANTRLSEQALNSIQKQVVKPNQTNNINNNNTNAVIKFDVDGKVCTPKETPKIKGYSLVEPSPSPMPGRLAGDESPMMVWGEIESTPLRLEASGFTPRGGPEFKIPDIPEREKIALNLEEKVSAERRKKKHEALKHVQRSLASPARSSINSPSISDRINNMSPAAQRLLNIKIKLDKTGSASPLVINRSPQVVKSPYLGIVSPRIKTNQGQEQKKLDDLKSNLKRPADSLTDNLLKLPKTN